MGLLFRQLVCVNSSQEPHPYTVSWGRREAPWSVSLDQKASCLVLPPLLPPGCSSLQPLPLWLILAVGWKTPQCELLGKGKALAVPKGFMFPGAGHLKRNCDVRPRAKTIWHTKDTKVGEIAGRSVLTGTEWSREAQRPSTAEQHESPL